MADLLPDLLCPPLSDGRYQAWFTDPDVFRPYVAAVADRHGLPAPSALSSGVPGSHPVFAAAEGYVVKFYAPHWPDDALKEQAAYRVLRALDAALVPRPRIWAEGRLFEAAAGWAWPYLVMSRARGDSVKEAAETLTNRDRAAVARALGPILNAVHRADWTGDGDRLFDFSRQRLTRLRREAVPRRLEEEVFSGLDPGSVERYMSRALATLGPPRLVHGDVTMEHVLLEPGADGVRVSALIDWADAEVRDPAWELVALYMDLFRCERALLDQFRAGYGTGPLFSPGWEARATAFLLLFPFAVGDALWAAYGDRARVRSPEELERLLWA